MNVVVMPIVALIGFLGKASIMAQSSLVCAASGRDFDTMM